MHAWRGWHWWPGADPFEVAAGAILVQNTAWTNAERALERLRAAGALTPGSMSALSQDELGLLIRPSGQYRQKALKLRALVDLIASAGSLDALLAEPAAALRARLLATWGIGEETADVIVLYASRQPAFVIDAYTRRVFSRLNLGPRTERYGDWQRYFAGRLPEDHELWGRYHALIVLHAKHVCRKREPLCGECALAPRCSFSGVAGPESGRQAAGGGRTG